MQVEPAKESLALRTMALDVDRLGQREEACFLLARLDAMLAIPCRTSCSRLRRPPNRHRWT